MTQDEKLNKAVKSLDFTTPEEYYEYCLESYINGNFEQCKKLFKALPKNARRALIRYMRENAPQQEKAIEFYEDLF